MHFFLLPNETFQTSRKMQLALLVVVSLEGALFLSSCHLPHVIYISPNPFSLADIFLRLWRLFKLATFSV